MLPGSESKWIFSGIIIRALPSSSQQFVPLGNHKWNVGETLPGKWQHGLRTWAKVWSGIIHELLITPQSSLLLENIPICHCFAWLAVKLHYWCGWCRVLWRVWECEMGTLTLSLVPTLTLFPTPVSHHHPDTRQTTVCSSRPIKSNFDLGRDWDLGSDTVSLTTADRPHLTQAGDGVWGDQSVLTCLMITWTPAPVTGMCLRLWCCLTGFCRTSAGPSDTVWRVWSVTPEKTGWKPSVWVCARHCPAPVSSHHTQPWANHLISKWSELDGAADHHQPHHLPRVSASLSPGDTDHWPWWPDQVRRLPSDDQSPAPLLVTQIHCPNILVGKKCVFRIKVDVPGDFLETCATHMGFLN